jgi:hypothetical protein
MEQRSQWNFESVEGGWTWTVTHADGRRESAVEPFKTLKQCVDDATQRGYVAWKAEDERRRDNVLGVTKTLNRNTGGQ